MGTRSLTVFKDESDKEIVVMYRQFDGYPHGHGQQLADFLKGRVLVDGYSVGDGENFNGMGCLAAQCVKKFKDGIGNFYLHAAGTRDVGEDYIYTVSASPGSFKIKRGNFEKEAWRVNLKCERSNAEIVFEGDADDWTVPKKGEE